MSNFLRLTVLLFSCMLSLSISKEDFSKPDTAKVQSTEQEEDNFYFSGSRNYKAFGLHQLTEVIVNGVNHLPAPQKKKYPNDSFGSSFSYEIRLQDVSSHYFYPLQEIACGLTVSDIIFPFHYFW